MVRHGAPVIVIRPFHIPPKKSSGQAPAATAPSKSVSTKQQSSTSLAKKASSVPQKKQPAKKKAPRKPKPKAPAKKPVKKKNAVEKPAKKVVLPEKQKEPESKKIPQQLPVAKPEQPKDQEEQQSLPQAVEVPLPEGPVLIARTATEKKTIETQLQIQDELIRVWRPPLGIPDGCSCQVQIVIGLDGIVTTVTMVQPSSILLFDVSVRAAVQTAQWPQATWGKTIELIMQ
jgi:hypothetical protein